MKTLFISFILSVLSLVGISQTYEVIISGVVTDIDSGEAVEGQMIEIMTDSMGNDFYYYNTVFTDASGYYEDVVDVTDGVSGSMLISTISCGTYLSEERDFSENETELEADFQVCGNPGGGDECQAMFYYYPANQNDGLTIQFMDDSWGNPTSWAWDFGDGEISDEQNPVHIYGDGGEYLVNLTIAGDSGDCSSSVEMMIKVGYDSIPEGCQAWFFYYPTDVPNSLQFIDESWGDPTSWAWDFGDGNTSDEQNPLHIYDDLGEYLVTLTISSDTCTSTYEEIVWVDSIVGPGDCEAQFFYYPACDSVPAGDLNYQFVDMSYGDPDTWAWDFGDGGTSDEQNPIHTFAEEGEYEVCLTITNTNDTCESTYCEMVYIYNDTIGDCFGWFEYTINDLDVDFQGYLMNSQTGEYTWDFGDGTSGSGASVLHTYADDGIYMVTMHVVDSLMGCDVEYTEDVWVGDSITFNVYGSVFLGDSLNVADVANVYLMTFDTIGDDLINVATTTINANGYYEFDGVGFEHCMYFIQAELTDGSAYFGDYVPTYHLDVLNWEEAWPVFPFPVEWTYDIYLQPSQGIQSGGGAIIGTVNAQESRGLLSNVEILLLHQDGTPITYMRTDENGAFDFPEMEFGTYVVYTEIVGIETTPATVTLTEDNPTAELTIMVANGEAILGIGEIASRYIDEVSDIYPNPVSENSSVNIEMKESGTVSLSVINQYGQVVYAVERTLPSGSSKINMNTNSLSPGLYIVNLKANDDIATVRKFVKLR
jgi:PKD repeat protein